MANAIQRLQRSEHEIALTRLQELSGAADDLIRSVRRIAADLRPPLLDQIGLAAAIESHAKELQDRAGIQIRMQAPEEWLPLSSEQRMALFRIVQEALTNVVRHAKASIASITLSKTSGELSVTVSDNGVGFRRVGRSLGLLGMEERAALIGATLSVESAPGHGTTVAVTLPLESNELANSVG